MAEKQGMTMTGSDALMVARAGHCGWGAERILTSRFLAYCLRDGEAGRAILGTAVILWAESRLQFPVHTLPDDDVMLAQLAGYGPDVAAWQAVRDRVLDGWQQRSVWDGFKFEPRLLDPSFHGLTLRQHCVVVPIGVGP